jgi:hypothetical protein
MNNIDKNVSECNICDKKYANKYNLLTHNRKFHCEVIKVIITNRRKFDCRLCNKTYSTKQSRWLHEKTCKIINNVMIEQKYNNEIELEKIKLERIKLDKIKKNIMKDDSLTPIVSNLKLQITKLEENQKLAMNNQLLNLIVDKDNKIEELNNQIKMLNYKFLDNNIENKELVTVNQEITEIKSLTFNGVVIVSRSDGFVDATELCRAGGKRFNHWYSLESTKQLVLVLKSKAGIPALDLIEINKGGNHIGSWIHPDLAIQLAQWISPSFALQVSEWIRTLFTDGNVSINIKLQNELKIKDNKIKLLEDIYLKKHKRDDYPESNVIYMVTTEANKNKRNYIIGKTTNLKNRLSTYNKTTEHEVIYYKSCKNESAMNIVETIILNKLEEYKEKANRDRFVLPLEKDISFFTDIINESINFLN